LRCASTTSSNLPKKIGIVRNSYSRRKLINANEWENLALANGYALIDPADLNAEDEINLFRNATHIIGESGSWGYLSGLNPDSQVIILTHDKDFIFWNEVSQLNSLRNSKFRIIRGRRLIHWPNKVNVYNLHSEWKLTRNAKRKIASIV
jgi:capsular polysaccharide biosynthesis protein